jgi:N-methylhydantoinase A
VLGRIDPTHSLGGDLTVDVDAAREAIERHVSSRIGQSVTQAAQGILDVASTNMQRALRVASVEQGHDPRTFSLVAYGGAGPLHATRLATEMSMPTVLVPRLAGVLSALGLLTTRLKYFRVSSLVEPLADLSTATLDGTLQRLIEETKADLESEGVPEADISVRCSLEMRYTGQSFSLTVPLEEPTFTDADRERVLTAFAQRHRDRYGHSSPDAEVEVVNLRVNAHGDTESLSLERADDGDAADAIVGTRDVWIRGEQHTCDVYEHGALPRDGAFTGPAIVQSTESTTLVGPEQSASVDPWGTVAIETGVTDGD